MRMYHALTLAALVALAALISLLGPVPNAPAPAAPAPAAAPIAAPQESAPQAAPYVGTRPESACRAAAYRIGATGNYEGTATERACFGEEDDPRVGLALDYGMTESQYAESERAQIDAETDAQIAAHAAADHAARMAAAQDSAAQAAPGLAVCSEEDGSAPGQAFPCRWDAAAQGNGTGESFTLWAADGVPDYS